MTEQEIYEWLAREPSDKRVPKALSVHEASYMLGFERKKILRAIKAGKLDALRFGIRYRIPLDVLVRWVVSEQGDARPGVFGGAPSRECARPVFTPHIR